MGKIQENMLKLDISQIHDQGNTFFSSADMAYLIFMIIGIAGYFTVPSVANYIIYAGGSNSLLHKVTSGFSNTTRSVASTTSSIAADAYGNTKEFFGGGFQSTTGEYFKDKISGK
jgi:phage terminase large subunit GpA-like protein